LIQFIISNLKSQISNNMFLKKIILPLAALLIITFFSFSPCLKSSFINWDDNEYVTETPVIRELSFENTKKIFSSFYVGCYLPATMISYSLEYKFFKFDPHVYHTVNLILHLLNCILVFWLFFLLQDFHEKKPKIFIPFVIALLFGIHPLHVESVAWIAERKDVLYSFFFLLSLIFYIYYYRQNKKLKFYFLSLLAFLLSMFSKPMAVSLPLVLLLVDFLFYSPFKIKILIEKIPFFVLSIVFGIVAIFGQKAAGATSGKSFSSILENILIACHGINLYLYKLLLPVNLSAIYPYPGNIADSCIYSPIVLLIIFGGALFSLKYTRKILFGFLFFLVTILPVLKLVPIGYAMIADRYTYIPFLGIFYIIAFCGARLYYKSAALKHIVTLFFIVVIVIFAYMTWNRCHVWKNAISLWNDIIKKCENPPPVAYNNRGEIYRSFRNPWKAIDDFSKAIAIDTNYSSAYLNRGTIFHELGKIDEAIKDYHMALKVAPKLQQAYNNLGNLHLQQGNLPLAVSNYNAALTIAPTFSESYNGRGLAHARLGMIDKAISDYFSATTYNPYHDKAFSNRGLLYQSLGNHEKAVEDFKKALEINSYFAEAYHHLAVSLFQLKQFEEAKKNMNKAKQFGLPIDSRAYEAFIKRCNEKIKISY